MNNSNREVYIIIYIYNYICRAACGLDWRSFAARYVYDARAVRYRSLEKPSPRKEVFFNLSSQLIDFYYHIGKNIAN